MKKLKEMRYTNKIDVKVKDGAAIEEILDVSTVEEVQISLAMFTRKRKPRQEDVEEHI